MNEVVEQECFGPTKYGILSSHYPRSSNLDHNKIIKKEFAGFPQNALTSTFFGELKDEIIVKCICLN